jgi:hypothetical protein
MAIGKHTKKYEKTLLANRLKSRQKASFFFAETKRQTTKSGDF